MVWEGFKRFISKKAQKQPSEGLWQKCPECGNLIFKKTIEENHKTCPECNYHYSLTARERIDLLIDKGTFKEFWSDIEPADPLKFNALKKYEAQIKQIQSSTGLKDAYVCGQGKLNDQSVCIGVLDTNFMMGSMGSVVGEKVTRSIEAALSMEVPLIIVSSSGGARMQESAISLMQMAKTSAALSHLKDKDIPYISILANPCTAGVLASFAGLGDLIIAEPRALIGFTGPRVIKQTIKQNLPDGFQTSEFLLKHGMIDLIVDRTHMKETISRILNFTSVRLRSV